MSGKVTIEEFKTTTGMDVSEDFLARYGDGLQDRNNRAAWNMAVQLAAQCAEVAQLAAHKEEVVQLAAQLAAHKEEVAQLAAQNKLLEERLADDAENQRRKHAVVLSCSAAAKDSTALDEFRKALVGREPCRGGFVAHKFYIDFVLTANLCKSDKRRVMFAGLDEVTKTEATSSVENLGEVLANRKDHSMLDSHYRNEEGPQSGIASDMFQQAINSLQGNDATDRSRLRVTHQQQLVTKVEGQGQHKLEYIQAKNTDSKRLKLDGPVKVNDLIDVCVWFDHPELGACVLALIEYKPNNAYQEQRQTQADMYGSNIMRNHGKACIVIDIAGGNTLAEWCVTAHALVPAISATLKPKFEKSLLFSGKGAEAIVLVAHGLVKAHRSFPAKLHEFGERLGPVVSAIDGLVYKAYDEAKTRRPNIDVIRDILDPDADIWTSEKGDLSIVQMKKFESDWMKAVSSQIFVDIAKKLHKLHGKYGAHGDIRLANLLSSGYIVDFDFVRADTYPSTLNLLSQDGRRHPDVQRMIEAGGSVKPLQVHDWFSLGHVMTLFIPEDESKHKHWDSFCGCIMEGQTQSIEEEGHGYQIALRNKDIPLPGTGNTPTKAQPTSKGQDHVMSDAYSD